jgi:cytochrome c553
MKIIFPIICSILLLGCSESKPTEAPVTSSSEPQSVAAPEANTSQQEAPAEQTISASSPVTAAPIAEKAAVEVPQDGGVLFAQKCASCHGQKAEKSALNKSQIIAGWNETQTKEALKGYQAGTYGKEMKAVMQGQTKPLDDAQIDALAKYISQL